MTDHEEPTTEAGRRLLAKLDAIGRSSQDTSFPFAEDAILAIESEARATAPAGLRRLRTLSDAATPGPWRHYSDGLSTEVQSRRKASVVMWPGFDDSSVARHQHDTNAAFIVAAVNYVRAALAADSEPVEE